MIDLTVARIAEIVGGRLDGITPQQAAELHVTGTVEFDSRAVTPGGLFLALPGARTDGHDFAAAAVAAGKGGAAGDDALTGATLGTRAPLGGLSTAQRAALSDLLRVRAAVAALAARAEEERTTRFLYAASRGRLPALRSELAAGISPDAADYDGRTALMLASAKGHREVVTLLLSSGADPSATDNFGGSALLEAARGGHDDVLDALLAGGGRWHLSAVATASELCTCVSECHMPLLRRYARERRRERVVREREKARELREKV